MDDSDELDYSVIPPAFSQPVCAPASAHPLCFTLTLSTDTLFSSQAPRYVDTSMVLYTMLFSVYSVFFLSITWKIPAPSFKAHSKYQYI